MGEVTDVELAILGINTVAGRGAYRGLKRRCTLAEQRLRGVWELVEELERELAEYKEKPPKFEAQNEHDVRWIRQPITLTDLARIGRAGANNTKGDGDDE